MTTKPVKEFSHLFKLLSLFHAGLLWFLSAVMKRFDSYYITQTGMIFYHRNICPTGYFFIWLFVSGYFWISVHLEVQSYDLALNLKPWFNISFESVVIVQEGQDQRFNQNIFLDQSYQILKRNMLQSHLSYSIVDVQQITTLNTL